MRDVDTRDDVAAIELPVGDTDYGDVLEALEPILSELDVRADFWQGLLRGARPYIGPLVLEVAAFVLLAFLHRPYTLAIGNGLILIAQIWAICVQAIALTRTTKELGRSGTITKGRLRKDLKILSNLSCSLKVVDEQNTAALPLLSCWLEYECDRRDAWSDRYAGRVTLLAVLAPFFAAAFGSSQPIHFFGATFQSGILYFWAIAMFIVWVTSMIGHNENARLRLVKKIVDQELANKPA